MGSYVTYLLYKRNLGYVQCVYEEKYMTYVVYMGIPVTYVEYTGI